MSSSTATSHPSDSADEVRTLPDSLRGELSELVERYAVAEFLPPADWITRLRLVEPRNNIQCLSESSRRCKRILDVSVASVALVLLSPLMLLTAVLVRLTSSGPIVFRQERVGLNLRGQKKPDRRQFDADVHDGVERRSGQDRRNDAHYGKPFVLFKFRTMRIDAEINGAQFARKNDPRVTPIGRFLRKTRIDELPQLYNVLRGEMSLVGPRPERPEFILELSDEIPDYLERLGLKPGLTGPAQVINGYDNNLDSFRRKVALDLLYLQNCCLWNDIKILVRTGGVVLTGKGAL